MRKADLREHEGRDNRRHDPEFSFREAEDRIGARDRDVATRNQARAAAERGAVDAADHRFAQAVERAEHARHGARVFQIRFAGELERGAHPLDVGAAAKGLACTGEDDGSHARVAVEMFELRAQLRDQLTALLPDDTAVETGYRPGRWIVGVTVAPDTNVADTSVMDTSVADTNVADTNVADSGVSRSPDGA